MASPMTATHEQRLQTLEHWLSVASELITMLTAMQSTIVVLQQETHQRLDLMSDTLRTAVETQQSIARLLVKVYDPAHALKAPFAAGPSQ
jgi:hypothetical protein